MTEKRGKKTNDSPRFMLVKTISPPDKPRQKQLCLLFQLISATVELRCRNFQMETQQAKAEVGE
jgi:hypothetical protein